MTAPARVTPTRSVLRSYAPIGAAVLAFLVMSSTVEPLPRARLTRNAGPQESAVGSSGPIQEGAPGTGGSVDTATGGAAGSAGQAAVGATGPVRGRGYVPPGAQPCADRALQVQGDPYSPPCYAFTGNNGGGATRGVTKDEIVVTVRQLEGPSAAEIFADISGERVNDSPEAAMDTVKAYSEYFQKRFNFYGRKLRVEFFKGQGSGSEELLGGGREKALADAVKASKEHGAFADISGITIPYADALSRQQVVNFGSPYPSRKWFVERRPYSWSLFPDGTNVVEASVAWITARLVGQKTAEYAGPAYKGQPRKYAVIAPENAEYQESVNQYITKVQGAGFNIAMNLKYKLDINSMPNQASNIIAQVKDAGITSLICACDPVMLALGLTAKANEQDYEPEWITAGLAFVEQDLVAQLIDDDQWKRAFGIAYNAQPEPLTRSFPYAAYKSQRPNDEPAFGFEEIYYQMYLLAIGVHMAGPNLTPQTFETGMFAYPGGSGPRGSWGFGEGDYTPMDDFREIWWSPTRISSQNNKPGAWVQLNAGARYFPGTVPRGRPPFFEQG
ncbi:MAG TPA: hypothetical protein VNB24_02465 [Acidimicrobiales bacterium]|nr:hypothetical protein [Acidimicrobiales bacterium]